MKEIEFSTYDVDEKGFIKNEKPRNLRDVYHDVSVELQQAGLLGDMDYFSMSSSLHCDDPVRLFPLRWKWIACYAVTGGSEGHYVHVDVTHRGADLESEKTETIFIGKTFSGMDNALEIAGALSKIMGA